MNTKRLVTLALGCVMCAVPACLAAQQDQASVADAARKAQAEKKTAAKAKMVIDNDNLGTLTGTINVVGQEPPTAGQQGGSAAREKSAEKRSAKDEAYFRQKFAAANKKLADDQHELDILQREHNLKQQQFYTDPMQSLRQEYSRQDLNDTKAKIDQKAADVAQDKQDLANLEDELRQAGGDPGWARLESQPQSQNQSEQPSPQPTPQPASQPAQQPSQPPAQQQ
jgi:chromosome segregation ATPase